MQTVTWFGLSLVLALFIPTIGKAIAMVGGLAGCFILVFPGMLHWCTGVLSVLKQVAQHSSLLNNIFFTVLSKLTQSDGFVKEQKVTLLMLLLDDFSVTI